VVTLQPFLGVLPMSTRIEHNLFFENGMYLVLFASSAGGL
jgi:hypothetical protein